MSAIRHVLPVLGCLLWLELGLTAAWTGTATAWAQSAAPGSADPGSADPGSAAPDAASSGAVPRVPRPEDVERPKLLQDAQPRYPAQAWAAQIETDVVVLLTLDTTGAVTEVALDNDKDVDPPGQGFAEAALLAARQLRFSPAKVAGVPTPIRIRYTFRFRIPEKETVARTPSPPAACGDAGCPIDERAPITLRGQVFERGRGKALAGVEVYILDRDEVVLTDEQGGFEINGPPGAYAFVIRPPDFYPFEAVERMEAGESLEVKYYVRRNRRARYTTIVWGSEGRAEVGRTSLVEDELRTIPGTFGDPIRVAMLMPGVVSSVSGLGYPIIRGALPGDSMYEVDGIPVPMLYHLLLGNTVVHRHFVDEMTFQPGGYGAAHGRFPGGRIAATSARVDEDPLLVADLSIIETSLFRSQRVGKSSEMVAAARYGTLGYIIEGLSANTVLRYWDYQTRLAHRFADGGRLTLTVLGAQDIAGDSDPETGDESVLRMGFHSADLRYRRSLRSDVWFTAGVQGGFEFFRPPPEEELEEGEEVDDEIEGSAGMWRFRPYLSAGYAPFSGLEFEIGGDFVYQDFDLNLLPDEDGLIYTADTGLTLGAWITAEWQHGPLIVNPSLRLDHYRYYAPNRMTDANAMAGVDTRDIETALEPRMAASYELHPRLTVKASAGLHSGPARFSFVEPPLVFGPIPAWEGPGLYWGLSRSWQFQGGITSQFPGDVEVALTGFYHDTFQPIDFSLLDKPLVADPTPCDGANFPDYPDPLDVDGRTYGAELMMRRRLGSAVFGWVSYAVSRSERTVPGMGTIPFEFDQTHVLNTVLSWEVGRNWTLGAVLHVNTGRPYTPFIIDACSGDDEEDRYFDARLGAPNAARIPTYWRIDARVQKREAFDTWFFDFYIDFFNASFRWETIDYYVDAYDGRLRPDILRLFLPTIGIRGEF